MRIDNLNTVTLLTSRLTRKRDPQLLLFGYLIKCSLKKDLLSYLSKPASFYPQQFTYWHMRKLLPMLAWPVSILSIYVASVIRFHPSRSLLTLDIYSAFFAKILHILYCL